MDGRAPLFDRLVVATFNPGKLHEFQALLAPFAREIVGAAALDLPEPAETGESFRANALLKAQDAARASGLPAVGDDSWLCVAALNDAPGLHTARWGGNDPRKAMEKLQAALGAAPDRSARFVCALALVTPEGREVVVEESCAGTLVWPPRGANGHGYDPMFAPTGETRTFGEMAPEEKAALGHRGRAFRALAAALQAKGA